MSYLLSIIACFIYQLLLGLSLPLAAIGWIRKMHQRNGLGTGIKQRFGFYDKLAKNEHKGGTYIHAISVGEVQIALKLIHELIHQSEEEIAIAKSNHFILAVTTSTAWWLAKNNIDANSKLKARVTLIYAPFDFTWLISSILQRFAPSQIVLIESELWPNLMHVAQKQHIPVSLINARLSNRSYSRMLAWTKLLAKLQLTPHWMSLQQISVSFERDLQRWKKLGFTPEHIHLTGNIKYDNPASTSLSQTASDEEESVIAQTQKSDHSTSTNNHFAITAVSTHADEELLITAFIAELREELAAEAEETHIASPLLKLIIIPRHVERCPDIIKQLDQFNFQLNRDYQLVDQTGQVPQWLEQSDVAIIGKSFCKKGGQNPIEPLQHNVPIICGPYMSNFEPLISELKAANAISYCSELPQSENHELADIHEQVRRSIKQHISYPQIAQQQLHAAQHILQHHHGATTKAAKLLRV